MKQKFTLILMLVFACYCRSIAQVVLTIDYNMSHQTIHSFGASDCWRTQYVGRNWPIEKRNEMADRLFGTSFDKEGNPTGIGLTLWRFNIGSGSHEMGDSSRISSEWRCTECFLDKNGNWDWDKQRGQQWFLEAAKKRGVKYTLGFSIAAPYFMAANGLARATTVKGENMNILDDKYDQYAGFLAEVSRKLKFDYLSPINEPQWDWNVSSQEGTPATNQESCRLIRSLDKVMLGDKTKIVFGEAADIKFLFEIDSQYVSRSDQIRDMFSERGGNSIYGLSGVEKVVSGHSYWSTWPVNKMIADRGKLDSVMKKELPKEYVYWQTEYCPMEKNSDNPNGGGGRDLGMDNALYISRVIHYDLTVCNAASWQSWTAFTKANYKDGLICIGEGRRDQYDSLKMDGNVYYSKYMWAMGNYSRFVRPGMIRRSIVGYQDDPYGIMASAYCDVSANEISIVVINYSNKDEKIELNFANFPQKKGRKFRVYQTSECLDLMYQGDIQDDLYSVAARSVTTFTTVK